jgi:hypothetical protein
MGRGRQASVIRESLGTPVISTEKVTTNDESPNVFR